MEISTAESSSLARSASFQAILDPLAPAFAALEAFLESQIDSFEPEVQPLVRYCFGHSGKKLRPILVFLTGIDGHSEAGEPLIKAPAIVELVHLATLVHDDILDEADVRHRTETLVARNGTHVAVLLGDALFAHALHLASEYPSVEVCRAVSRATRQVCSGEIAQTFAREQGAPDVKSYFRMIDLKTAELFAVSAYLGGYLAGYSSQALEAAKAFARHLGLAYQIYDDAADIFGKESQAGKTLGTDLATGKFTLPVLFWLESQPLKKREEALAGLRDGQSREDLQERLLETGTLDRVAQAFLAQIHQARGAVESIPGTGRRQALLQLADFVEQAWNKFAIH